MTERDQVYDFTRFLLIIGMIFSHFLEVNWWGNLSDNELVFDQIMTSFSGAWFFILGISFFYSQQNCDDPLLFRNKIWIKSIFLIFVGMIITFVNEMSFSEGPEFDVLVYLGISIISLYYFQKQNKLIKVLIFIFILLFSQDLRSFMGYYKYWDLNFDYYTYRFPQEMAIPLLGIGNFAIFPWVLFTFSGYLYMQFIINKPRRLFFIFLISLILCSWNFSTILSLFIDHHLDHLNPLTSTNLLLLLTFFLLIYCSGLILYSSFRFKNKGPVVIFNKFTLSNYFIHMIILGVLDYLYFRNPHLFDMFGLDRNVKYHGQIKLILASLYLVFTYFLFKIWSKKGRPLSLEYIQNYLFISFSNKVFFNKNSLRSDLKKS